MQSQCPNRVAEGGLMQKTSSVGREAGSGGMQSQAKEHQQPPEADEAGGFSPRTSRESVALPTP